MRKLTFLLAVLTASTTACIATGDDLEVDQPTSRFAPMSQQAVEAQLADNGRIFVRVGTVTSGPSAIEGVVLDRDGRVIGELHPGGAVGELATELAPELLPVDVRGDVESIELVVETFTADGVVTRSPVSVDMSQIQRSR